MVFAGEAKKNMFFRPQTQIFHKNQKNTKNNVKIQGFLGNPVETPVEIRHGENCQAANKVLPTKIGMRQHKQLRTSCRLCSSGHYWQDSNT